MKRFVRASVVLSSLLYGDIFYTIGLHVFMVNDIEPNPQIFTSLSHAVGFDLGLEALRKFDEDTQLHAALDLYYDYQIDELDPDHIPVSMEYFVDLDSVFAKYRFGNFTWGMHIENKQNTVSCIEQEMNDYLYAGYRYKEGAFSFGFTQGLGVHYFEIDDDTPKLRGYSRDDLEDSQTSFISAVDFGYKIDDIFIELNARYISTYYYESLRSDIGGVVHIYDVGYLPKGSSINLKYRYTQYDLSRFQTDGYDVAVLPWDNDAMFRFYTTIPF